MFNRLLKTKERQLLALYSITTLLIYCAFLIGWHFSSSIIAISIGIALGIFCMIILLIHKIKCEKQKIMNKLEIKNSKCDSIRAAKFPVLPLVIIILFNIAISFLVSSFFLFYNIKPSYFFALFLIIMLGYKIIQLIIGDLILKNSKDEVFLNIYFSLFIFAELVALVWVGILAGNNAILWEVFFAISLCISYTFGQFLMRRNLKKDFWDQAVIIYLCCYIWIFLILILLLSKGDRVQGGGFSGKSRNDKNPMHTITD